MNEKPEKQSSRHPFEKIPEFADAVKKLIKVPKEEIERAERETRTPRTPKKES